MLVFWDCLNSLLCSNLPFYHASVVTALVTYHNGNYSHDIMVLQFHLNLWISVCFLSTVLSYTLCTFMFIFVSQWTHGYFNFSGFSSFADMLLIINLFPVWPQKQTLSIWSQCLFEVSIRFWAFSCFLVETKKSSKFTYAFPPLTYMWESIMSRRNSGFLLVRNGF